MTRESDLLAAEVLEGAHDVLLETGVYCAETKGQGDGLSLESSDDTPNCLWQAIAISLGLKGLMPLTGGVHDWSRLWDHAYNQIVLANRRFALVDAGVALSLAGAGVETFHWNDEEAKVDDVFDHLKDRAKFLRERAGEAE